MFIFLYILRPESLAFMFLILFSGRFALRYNTKVSAVKLKLEEGKFGTGDVSINVTCLVKKCRRFAKRVLCR